VHKNSCREGSENRVQRCAVVCGIYLALSEHARSWDHAARRHISLRRRRANRSPLASPPTAIMSRAPQWLWSRSRFQYSRRGKRSRVSRSGLTRALVSFKSGLSPSQSGVLLASSAHGMQVYMGRGSLGIPMSRRLLSRATRQSHGTGSRAPLQTARLARRPAKLGRWQGGKKLVRKADDGKSAPGAPPCRVRKVARR